MGGRENSAGKALAWQVQGPQFDLQDPQKCALLTPALGKWETGESLGLWPGSLIGDFQTNQRLSHRQ